MLRVLARYPAIFSHVGHIAMAADAPDLHRGDLGRLGEVKNVLIGADIVGHRKSIKSNLLDCFAFGTRRRGRLHI